MSDIAIRVECLGKRYRVGQQRRYRALRDSLATALSAPARAMRAKVQTARHNNHRVDDTFWALRDVSFEVKRGEVLGVIGRNGAGKSTLLKLLSRITQPTEGSIDIYGRVGSLLEVGTGFNPELTGRENIYLNGAIMGMRRTEIARKFDQMVEFAEVQRFLDTPVKRYSSGMYMRLAFSVAAHLEPEILLVDEVLAVGDASFQKKCLGKMGEVAQEGRTVILVSHNMAAIHSLSTRALLLDEGHLVCVGSVDMVTVAHLQATFHETTAPYVALGTHPRRRRGSVTLLQGVTLRNAKGIATHLFSPSDSLVLDVDIYSASPLPQPIIGIGVDNSLGIRVFSATTLWHNLEWDSLHGNATARCSISRLNLMPGTYVVSVSAGSFHNAVQDLVEHAISFQVELGDYFGNGRVPLSEHGVVLADSSWEIARDPALSQTGHYPPTTSGGLQQYAGNG